MDTSACVNVEILGIEQKPFSDNINLFPNPSSGFIKIKLEKQYPGLQIRVNDVKGNIVKHHKFVTEDNIYLDIEGEKGIYFIELLSQDKNTTIKVVKN